MDNVVTKCVNVVLWDDSVEAIETLLKMFSDKTLYIEYRQDEPTCTISIDSERSIVAEIGDYVGTYNGIPVVLKMLKGDS